MTGRERELAAIRREETDRLPIDVICIEPLEEIGAYLGVAPDAVYDALGIDGRIVVAPRRRPQPQREANPTTDEWGAPAGDDYGRHRSYPLADTDTATAVERHPWPYPTDYDYGSAAMAARALGDRYAVRGPYWLPIACRAFALFGMEEALVRLHESDPGLLAALDRIADVSAGICERLLDACGEAMPILCLGDDFATQRGLLMQPAIWRRHLKPLYARLFEVGKRRGKLVWFHSCGDVTAVLGDLIDIGADVWETVQLHALPMSASDLKREYGRRLTFFGGINTQRLPFIGPVEVEAEVREAIAALGPGGGYICGPDHHIKPDVDPAVAVALFRAAARFGQRASWRE